MTEQQLLILLAAILRHPGHSIEDAVQEARDFLQLARRLLGEP